MEHLKICGAETDNMSYGAEGLQITVEEEAEVLERQLNSNNKIMLLGEVNGVIVGTANYSGSNKKRTSHRGGMGLCVQKKILESRN